jgi:hypothetical protein
MAELCTPVLQQSLLSSWPTALCKLSSEIKCTFICERWNESPSEFNSATVLRLYLKCLPHPLPLSTAGHARNPGAQSAGAAATGSEKTDHG